MTPSSPAPALKKPALQKPLQGFSLLNTCTFSFRTVEEAALLSRFTADMFHDPARAQPGLYELLLNAVEHGCLGIGNEMKTKLMQAGAWQAEITRRESLPENRRKTAELVVTRKDGGVFAVITDPGPGFDWKNWVIVDPTRAGALHGRGIARARGMSFDAIAYNPVGNQVIVQMKNTPEMQW